MAALRGLFITGTGTGVGKTWIAQRLIGALRAQGLTVRARKPVESGCAESQGIPQDARALSEAAGNNDPLTMVCPWPLRAAISSERAAALEGRTIILDDVAAACASGITDSDFLLVEGAGGFLSPLTGDARNAELAAHLGLPVLLVVADRLGCLDHAMLTAEAIAARGLSLAAVVLNSLPGNAVAGMDNAADLEKWLKLPVWRTPQMEALAAQLARGVTGPLQSRPDPIP